MQINQRITALAFFAGSSAAAFTQAGGLQVDWSTIDAGGGIAAGGAFELNGTIAQIDAEPLQPASGGNFQLTGGFWVVANLAASDALFKDGFEGL